MQGDTATRVMIVEDHKSVQTSVRDFLNYSGCDVVGTAGSAEGALSLAKETAADVALLDLKLGSCDGLDVMADLLAVQPELRFVAFTALHGGHVVQRALERGALGFVVKDSGLDEVLAAVKMASLGQQYLCPMAARCMDESRAVPLPTERERKVLGLQADGYSVKEAAEKMNVTENTMESYRRDTRKKLGLVSEHDVISYARRNGLTE